MPLTVELVTSPVVCMICHREYKRMPSPPDLPGAPSHGVCPERECQDEFARRCGFMNREVVQ